MTSVVERVRTIDPVPLERRTLSGLDLAILWGDLGVGLLVLVTGGLLVPGLSFGAAMAAIVIGSVAGVAVLGVTGAIGARSGVPTMVLFRPVLGVRGSWLPSMLNFAQLVGWTAVELWAMSLVADIVVREVFGFSARNLWLAIVAVLCTGLALWGPVGVTRVYLKSFGAWMVLAICATLTVFVFGEPAIRDALTSPGTGEWPTFGLAIDLVIAMPVSWLPLVADYTRFGRAPQSAGWGTALGYLAANVWLYALGALIILGSGEASEPAGMAVGILAIAGGTVAGALFLVGILVGETDEAFADIYSGAVSLQNVFPRASRRLLTILIAGAGTALAAVLTMQLYESFLFLLGSVFVPLFGVLLADFAVFRGAGPNKNVRWSAFLPWAAGFVVYHWIAPTGPEWWTETSAMVFGTPLSERFAFLGASVPSFVVSAGLAWLLALRSKATRKSER